MNWPVLPVVARLLEARSCSDMIMIWYIERLWGLSVMSKLRDSALIFKAWSSTWSDLHPHGKDLLFEVHLSGNSSQSALCTFFLFFPPHFAQDFCYVLWRACARLTQAAHILLALEHIAELGMICCVGLLRDLADPSHLICIFCAKCIFGIDIEWLFAPWVRTKASHLDRELPLLAKLSKSLSHPVWLRPNTVSWYFR